MQNGEEIEHSQHFEGLNKRTPQKDAWRTTALVVGVKSKFLKVIFE